MTATPGQSTDPSPAADPATAGPVLDFLERRTGLRWEPDTDLFESGSVSSLFAMELVVFLEGEFDVEIGGPDLKLDNFRTVHIMAGLVERLRAEDDGPHGDG